jgi:uncharacterized protein involved in exopolysaccharide biosynthesis
MRESRWPATLAPGVMTLPTALAAVARRAHWVAAAGLVVGAVAFVLSSQTAPTYAAEATVDLARPHEAGILADGDRRAPGPGLEAPVTVRGARFLRNIAEFAYSGAALQRAATQVPGFETDEELAEQVELTAVPPYRRVAVRAVAGSPRRAAQLANAAARGYRQRMAEDVAASVAQAEAAVATRRAQLRAHRAVIAQSEPGELAAPPARANLAALAAELDRLERVAQRISVAGQRYGDGVHGLTLAEPPSDDAAIRPRPGRDAALAAVLAAAVAVLVALGRGLATSRRAQLARGTPDIAPAR